VLYKKWTSCLSLMQAFSVLTLLVRWQKELEIWGRAQREAARRCKSDCGQNLGEFRQNSVRSNVTCTERSYISLHSKHSVHFGWVDISHVNSIVSGPKFTIFLFHVRRKNGELWSTNNRVRIRSWFRRFQLVDSVIHPGDIRAQSLKLSKIAPNF